MKNKTKNNNNNNKKLHAPIMVVEVKGFSDLTDIMIIDLAVQEE